MKFRSISHNHQDKQRQPTNKVKESRNKILKLIQERRRQSKKRSQKMEIRLGEDEKENHNPNKNEFKFEFDEEEKKEELSFQELKIDSPSPIPVTKREEELRFESFSSLSHSIKPSNLPSLLKMVNSKRFGRTSNHTNLNSSSITNPVFSLFLNNNNNDQIQVGVVDLLGEGGFGHVYLSSFQDERIAIKIEKNVSETENRTLPVEINFLSQLSNHQSKYFPTLLFSSLYQVTLFHFIC